jgi:hypothetical protein
MLPCWRDALLRRPWALWLALLLAVVSALGPSLSHGLAAGHGSVMALQDICISNGPDRLADASTPDQPASPASPETPLAGGLNDCPLCLLAQDRLAGLPPGPVQLLVAGLLPEPPRAGPLVIRRVAVALAPPARGPPTFS